MMSSAGPLRGVTSLALAAVTVAAVFASGMSNASAAVSHDAKSRAERTLASGREVATISPISGVLRSRLLGAIDQTRTIAVADTVEPAATAPSDASVSGSAGVVTATASSTAAYVAFSADEADFGPPVAVSDGVASTHLTTWGWPNGTHELHAVDCSGVDPASCNSANPLTITFPVINTAPEVTSPLDGSTVTGGFTVTATSAGGGVQFRIDGLARGFDGTAPYAFTYSGSALAPGEHVITAVQCAADNSRCDGPESDAVLITSDSLHPTVVAVSPGTFSPNGDKVKDSTTLTYALPDTETVAITVTNSAGTSVTRGPLHLGTLHRGRHTWTWNGRTNSGRTAPSGTYRISVATSATVRGAVVKGLVWRTVSVDTRAPAAASLTGDTTIYPYRDGYKDGLTVRFRLSERATTVLTIRNGANKLVRTVTSVRPAGAGAVSWNARTAAGRSLPVGAYTWRLRLRDAVGNTAQTGAHRVNLSNRRLVTKSVDIVRDGDGSYESGGSDPSCAGTSTSESDYAHGLWLANACPLTGDIAAAFYRVNVPAAVSYGRFTVSVYGWSLYAPAVMTTAFGVAGGSSDFGFGGFHRIATSAERWYTIGSIAASDFISSNHRANVAVTLTDDEAPCDFDVKQVKIHLTYQVLN
jgi:flagellar hook assembly protein FlgD